MKATMKHELTNIHEVVVIDGSNVAKYVFPTIDVCFELEINSGKYWAIYQTAQSYYNNDYNTPSNQLAISADAGTSKIINQIDMLCISDFDNKATIEDLLENYGDEYIKSLEDVLAVYDCLRENQPHISEYVSIELDDYEENEDGELSLIEK